MLAPKVLFLEASGLSWFYSWKHFVSLSRSFFRIRLRLSIDTPCGTCHKCLISLYVQCLHFWVLLMSIENHFIHDCCQASAKCLSKCNEIAYENRFDKQKGTEAIKIYTEEDICSGEEKTTTVPPPPQGWGMVKPELEGTLCGWDQSASLANTLSNLHSHKHSPSKGGWKMQDGPFPQGICVCGCGIRTEKYPKKWDCAPWRRGSWSHSSCPALLFPL